MPLLKIKAPSSDKELLNILHQIFNYDEVNGGFVWKQKLFGMNKHIKEGDVAGALHKHMSATDKNWRTQYTSRVVTIAGVKYKISHLVWLWFNGVLPNPALVVAHLNDNPLDNRIDNLHVCSQYVNMQFRERYGKENERGKAKS